MIVVSACTVATDAASDKDRKLKTMIEPSMLLAAETAEAQYDYESAAGSYRSLLQRHPTDVTMAVRLARALRYSGKPDQAIAVLTPMTTAGEPAAAVMIELGKAHLAADHLNLALRYLGQAKELAPANWEVHSALGVAYDYQGKFADAQAAYVEALSLSPNNPSVLNNLGLSQAQSGDLEGAIETLRKAVDQPQASAQVRQNLALVMALSGNTEEAERYARMDLPREVLRENAAYYRSLSTRR